MPRWAKLCVGLAVAFAFIAYLAAFWRWAVLSVFHLLT
jgi:hypothetical protein